MLVFLLLGELTALFFLSRWLTQSVFALFLLVFRARSVAVTIVLLLEFPGTVVHELAHLFTAEILRVPTGKLTLVPESIREETVRSGSVTIAETDPIRRSVIGLAPLFAGILVLTAISYFLPQVLPNREDLRDTGYWGKWSSYLFLALSYLLFAVSNTMFSSSEDLKGFWPVAIIIGVLFGTLYFIGIRLELTGSALVVATNILTTLVGSLGVVLGINVVLLLVTKLLASAVMRVFRVKIVS